MKKQEYRHLDVGYECSFAINAQLEFGWEFVQVYVVTLEGVQHTFAIFKREKQS